MACEFIANGWFQVSALISSTRVLFTAARSTTSPKNSALRSRPSTKSSSATKVTLEFTSFYQLTLKYFFLKIAENASPHKSNIECKEEKYLPSRNMLLTFSLNFWTKCKFNPGQSKFSRSFLINKWSNKNQMDLVLSNLLPTTMTHWLFDLELRHTSNRTRTEIWCSKETFSVKQRLQASLSLLRSQSLITSACSTTPTKSSLTSRSSAHFGLLTFHLLKILGSAQTIATFWNCLMDLNLNDIIYVLCNKVQNKVTSNLLIIISI